MRTKKNSAQEEDNAKIKVEPEIRIAKFARADTLENAKLSLTLTAHSSDD